MIAAGFRIFRASRFLYSRQLLYFRFRTPLPSSTAFRHRCSRLLRATLRHVSSLYRLGCAFSDGHGFKKYSLGPEWAPNQTSLPHWTNYSFVPHFRLFSRYISLWNDLDWILADRSAWLGVKGCRVTHERRRHERNVGSRKPWTSRIPCTPGRIAPFLGRGVVLIKFQWLVAQLLATSRLQTSKWKPDRHNMLASLANDIDLLQIGFEEQL